MKYSTVCVFSKLIVFLLFLAQSVLIPFFSLYLKYLNFSLLQMGVIRALMMWIPIAVFPLSIITINKVTSNIVRRTCISGSIFTTITICICFIFVAPIQNPNSVTHCENTATAEIGEDNYIIINTNSSLKTKPQAEISNVVSKIQLQENISPNNIRKEGSRDLNKIGFTLSPIHKVNKEKLKNVRPINSIKLLEDKLQDTKSMKHLRYFFNNIRPDQEFNQEENKFKLKLEELEKEMQSSTISSVIYSIQVSPQQDTFKRDGQYGSNLLPYFVKNYKKDSKVSQNHASSLENMENQQVIDNSNNGQNTKKSLSRHNELIYDNSDMRDIKNEKLHDYEEVQGSQRDQYLQNTEDKLFLSSDQNTEAEMDYHSGHIIKKRHSENLIHGYKYQNKTRNPNSLVNNSSHINSNVSQLLKSTKSLLGLHVLHTFKQQLFGSETFLTVLILAILYETLFCYFIPWTEVLCYYNSDEYSYEHLFTAQIFLFKTPGLILSYPVVAFLASMSPCPYQLAMHPFMGVIVLTIAFLVSLLFLSWQYPEIKHFRSRKPSKPSPTEKQLRESPSHKFITSVTNLLLGICVASHAEFILWKAESLSGFPFNYEYLYCGYFSLNVLSYILTDKYIQYRKSKTDISYNEEDSEEEESVVHFSYEWFMNTKQIIYTENQRSNLQIILGTFFLTVSLFVITLINKAWFLLPVALLKGIADATIESSITEGSWTIVIFGYGIGCWTGSLISSFLGIDYHFYVSSACMLICFAGWLIYSVFLQSFKRAYTQVSLGGECHISGNQELNKEDEYEEDWLAKALRTDQQNQSNSLKT